MCALVLHGQHQFRECNDVHPAVHTFMEKVPNRLLWLLLSSTYTARIESWRSYTMTSDPDLIVSSSFFPERSIAVMFARCMLQNVDTCCAHPLGPLTTGWFCVVCVGVRAAELVPPGADMHGGAAWHLKPVSRSADASGLSSYCREHERALTVGHPTGAYDHARYAVKGDRFAFAFQATRKHSFEGTLRSTPDVRGL